MVSRPLLLGNRSRDVMDRSEEETNKMIADNDKMKPVPEILNKYTPKILITKC